MRSFLESKEAGKRVMSECQSYNNIKKNQLVENKIPAFRQEKQEQLFSET